MDIRTQTIGVAGYTFQGPFTSLPEIQNVQGVYAILDRRADGKWHIVDVGEAGEGVNTRIDTHNRKECWARHSQGVLGAAVYYTPNWTDVQRHSLEAMIRNNMQPPCGQR